MGLPVLVMATSEMGCRLSTLGAIFLVDRTAVWREAIFESSKEGLEGLGSQLTGSGAWGSGIVVNRALSRFVAPALAPWCCLPDGPMRGHVLVKAHSS